MPYLGIIFALLLFRGSEGVLCLNLSRKPSLSTAFARLQPFSPSRKKQGDAAQRNKKKKRRRRTGQSSKNSTNSSDEYSDVDTRNGAYGHHGDFLPKRPARSTRSAALLSASAFRRPTPPPATMEQPFEIDCDEGNDEVEAADGDGADQDDASAGTLPPQSAQYRPVRRD